jgi:protein subunit release factor A
MTWKTDFAPLIDLLSEVDKLNSLEAQYEALERALVASEVNPEPALFFDLMTALVTLQRLHLEGREWNEQVSELLASQAI